MNCSASDVWDAPLVVMSFVEAETVVPPAAESPDSEPTVEPTAEELSVLNPMERFAFRVTHQANQGAAKQFWTRMQQHLGALWIHLATYNIMRVYGLEHVAELDHARPVLLVANHRSFFDMYAVSSVLYRRTTWRKQLFFPVRGRFFYTSPLGMLVNLVMGWWSMYPPFFYTAEKKLFDRYSLRRLVTLCREGAGNIIGFHPEGTRNKSDDPYSFLPAKPGVGKLIMEAQPQVLPVFVTGLANSLGAQVMRNWTDGEPIRIHFGAPLDLTEFYTKRDAVRTHKEISEYIMARIAQLAEQDRGARLANAGDNFANNTIDAAPAFGRSRPEDEAELSDTETGARV